MANKTRLYGYLVMDVLISIVILLSIFQLYQSEFSYVARKGNQMQDLKVSYRACLTIEYLSRSLFTAYNQSGSNLLYGKSDGILFGFNNNSYFYSHKKSKYN